MDSQVTYKVGGLMMTQQAYLLLLAGTSLSLIILLGSLFLLPSSSAKLGGVTFAVVVFAVTCYASYVTNCTIVGKCNVLAWVLVVANMLVFFGYAMMFVQLLADPSPSPRPRASSRPKK